MAEGLARQIFPEAKIESAGSHPGKLNPFAVAVMKEIGIDISAHFSKSVEGISPEFLENLTYVITLCAEEVCPAIISKAKKMHWPFQDPVTKSPITDKESLERFRMARDAIRARLIEFGKNDEGIFHRK